jgi:hypothetical protein
MFVEVFKIKLHVNLSSGSRAGTLGQTDGQRIKIIIINCKWAVAR